MWLIEIIGPLESIIRETYGILEGGEQAFDAQRGITVLTYRKEHIDRLVGQLKRLADMMDEAGKKAKGNQA
jgi:hypothetical protein